MREAKHNALHDSAVIKQQINQDKRIETSLAIRLAIQARIVRHVWFFCAIWPCARSFRRSLFL